MALVSKTVSTAKDKVRSVFHHPLWYLVFGLLFVMFLFPLVASLLGKLKFALLNRGGVLASVGNLIPDSIVAKQG